MRHDQSRVLHPRQAYYVLEQDCRKVQPKIRSLDGVFAVQEGHTFPGARRSGEGHFYLTRLEVTATPAAHTLLAGWSTLSCAWGTPPGTLPKEDSEGDRRQRRAAWEAQHRPPIRVPSARVKG